MLEINKVYNVDCLGEEGMCLMPDKSVHLILADLPYGKLNRSNVIAWDNIIPFKPLWEQYERIITDNGVIVLFSNQPFTSQLLLSNIKLFKQEIVWCKKDSADFVNANNRPLQSHENILVFSKADIANGCKNKMIYNPQGLIALDKQRKVSKKDGAFYGKRENQDNKDYVQKFTNYPKSYVFFDREINPIHYTQKPVPLCKYLVETYSNPGDTVLDNCCGSGSSLMAASISGRNYIGMDNGFCQNKKKEQYYGRSWAEISTERIVNYTSQIKIS